MSLAVAQLMLARLTDSAGDAALAAWAETWAQAAPQVTLGYRRPTGAEGWPFIALVPLQEDRSLQGGGVASATVALAAGVRLASQARPAADGISAADALVDAALDVLGTAGARYLAHGWVMVPTVARRVDAEFSHPVYEIECHIDLVRLGGPL